MENPVNDDSAEMTEKEIGHPLRGMTGQQQSFRLRLTQAIPHGAQGVAGWVHGGGDIWGIQPPLIVTGGQFPTLIFQKHSVRV